ncbi:MAG: Cell division protein FtsI [Peptidoglycan synthetase], partial [uncultured Solirubrobacterales bacterium]
EPGDRPSVPAVHVALLGAGGLHLALVRPRGRGPRGQQRQPAAAARAAAHPERSDPGSRRDRGGRQSPPRHPRDPALRAALPDRLAVLALRRLLVHRPRPVGPRAVLQRRAGRAGQRARHHRRRAERRPGGRQPAHHARPRGAGGRPPGPRWSARIGGGARAGHRPGAGHGQPARLRPQLDSRALQRAERRGELAAVQPRHPGALSAGLDLQGGDGGGGARQRRVHTAVDRLGQERQADLRRPAPELRGRGVRPGHAHRGAREVDQHRVGGGRRAARRLDDAAVHAPLRVRQRATDRPSAQPVGRQRDLRRGWPTRRQRQHRHRPRVDRPGAPPGHAAADGHGRLGDRQRGNSDGADLRRSDGRARRSRHPALSARSRAQGHSRGRRARPHRDDDPGRRRGLGDRGPAPGRARGRQDRDGRARRRGQPGVVHRLCPGRRSEDRSGRDRRAGLRHRRRGRGADRPPSPREHPERPRRRRGTGRLRRVL